MSQFLNYYIGGIFLVAAEIIFGKLVLESNPKISKIKLIISLLIFPLLSALNYFLANESLRMLISFIIFFILYKSMFKCNIGKTLFITFLCTILLLPPDMIIMLIAIYILGISKTYYLTVFAGSILANVLVCIVFVIMSFLVKKPLNKLINIKIETNIKILIFSICTFLCLIYMVCTILIEMKVSNILPYLGAMILLMIILFSLFKEKLVNNKLVLKYDQLLEFMKTYEEEVEKERILRHENKNQLIAIKSKIIDKEKETKIVSYIDEIINESTSVNKEQYAQFRYLPANGIKGLFYYKVGQAENLGLKVSINVSKGVEKTVIYDLDSKKFNQLGKVIGVFLDNAIEASSDSKTKMLGIEIYSKDEEVEMIISNSYVNNIGGIGNSTKGKNRGHGLLLVKSILSKNTWLEQNVEITDKLYIQKLKIKKSI